MNNCIPFYTENNSHNLPFYILKDKNKNDVVYINKTNIIYTNSKNIDLSKQILYYNYCLDKGLWYVYRINDDVNIIKKVINNDAYYFLCNNEKEYYIYYHDNRWDNEINIHSNGNYLCLTSNEYQDYIGDIVFGYDINKHKLLDYNDPTTNTNMYKYLIDIRRCRFDLIYAIVNDKNYVKDKRLLYNFLSFILDTNIDEENYVLGLPMAKKMILNQYPNIENIDDIYDINKFCFHRDCKKIKNLKYIK